MRNCFCFLISLNTNNRNIVLFLQYYKSNINFLDLTISKGKDGQLHITVYRKAIDRNTELKADSFHNWPKNNIPFSQFQCLQRICDLFILKVG